MIAEHSLWRRVRWLAVLAALCMSAGNSATLTSQTVAAWEAYLRAAHARLEESVQTGRELISLDETEARGAQIRGGDPLIFPVGRTPEKVPSGLIHDWVGIGFIPNAKISDVLSTIRDYEHYPDIYHPAVVESTVSKRDGLKDQFHMLLVNKSVASRTALDGDFEALYVRIDDHRWYSISKTTRIQEVENYRGVRQETLPENEGAGLIWRLSSITRFEERDGGVYIELEAIALSRDIPVSLRWIATPIVRRVSKNSLLTSLQQTTVAVCARNSMTELSASGRHAALPRDRAANKLGSFR